MTATAAPTGAGNYRLWYGSPAIDYGTASVVTLPATDLDGQPRVTNAAVDAGAYEFPAYTLTVNRIGEGSVQRVLDQDTSTYLTKCA
ncbi:choice-of-anchor Q domain-containing protein [Chloroflexus aggregans]|uniref:Uncharacterized protein n=1 Tax=Chloroflexus aggregans (strain MD-66 / DSM 9485) TaxID=326427 RepID=B8G9M2_CHLAD|nr:hypothetical protein Cagg_3537 [Chloroflexus aggregans DSM 9485]